MYVCMIIVEPNAIVFGTDSPCGRVPGLRERFLIPRDSFVDYQAALDEWARWDDNGIPCDGLVAIVTRICLDSYEYSITSLQQPSPLWKWRALESD